jgi:uncharacterized protein (DUF952 family)
MIYHIVTPEYWEQFSGKEHYFSETFEQEKFIHCSTIGQLAGVLERYYKGAGTVLRLEIDEVDLAVKPVYEVAPNGEEFPHIYGGINKGAIISVTKLSETSPGEYTSN